VKEPFALTLMLGLAAPAEVITAVRRIIELTVARAFVTVVFEPVTAAYPKELGLRPEEVGVVPDPSQEAFDIST
jgi:hypothetical protein